MTESQDPSISSTQPDAAPALEAVQPFSVSDKFVGLFTEPVTTFDNIRQAGPRALDWVVPLLALTVVLLAATLIRFSNPEFVADIAQKQQEAFQKQVDNGQMTQEQADKIQEQMGQWGGMQKIFSAIGVVIGVPVVFFLMALLFWLLTRFALRGDITFTLLLSVYGLTAYIGVVDQLVSLLLGFATGNFYATLSAGLFLRPDLSDSTYKLLNQLNPLQIWSYYLLGLALHRVAFISKAKAFGLVIGLWLLWVLASSFISVPGMG